MATKVNKTTKKEIKTTKSVKPTSSVIAKKVLVDRISDKIAKTHSLTKAQIESVLNEYLEVKK
ncbi:MAG: hypothetical protein mread185_000116 [Mycoplasmataceae bacterium]|nr:MAG: hypothetical protein mread185_000116 [Mycoplasmataceae bacterium]